MPVTLRSLPTAYEPGGATLTVATPSCCCCCCCANTALATVLAVGGVAYGTAERHGRSRALSLLLALSMVPFAVLATYVLPLPQPGEVALWNLVPAYVVGAVVAGVAFRFAGMLTLRAVGLALALFAASAIALYAEMWLALMSGFLIELFVAVAAVAAWVIGRSQARGRVEPALATERDPAAEPDDPAPGAPSVGPW